MALADILQAVSPLQAIPTWGIVLLTIWVFTWKGFALWKSARLNQPIWFIAILVINTLGILEILYIFVFSKFAFDHLKMKKK